MANYGGSVRLLDAYAESINPLARVSRYAHLADVGVVVLRVEVGGDHLHVVAAHDASELRAHTLRALHRARVDEVVVAPLRVLVRLKQTSQVRRAYEPIRARIRISQVRRAYEPIRAKYAVHMSPSEPE
eukprot:2454284-Pyramimonas_sp.AAC.1